MLHREDHFFAVSMDVLRHIKVIEDLNYSICRDHRELYKISVNLDLRELNCEIQPCRTTCPFNLMEQKECGNC